MERDRVVVIVCMECCECECRFEMKFGVDMLCE